MENLILSKLENLKINNNNNKNFYNRDKELYKFLLSKDFYDQVFKTLKINIPEDLKIFLINDLINQISERKIRFFSGPCEAQRREVPTFVGTGDEAAFLPPSSEGGTKKNYFDQSSLDIIQEYILEEGFSYILGCIWKNGNIKTEYDNKLEFLNSKKKFLSSLSFPFTGEGSIDSVSYLSSALLSVRSTSLLCASHGQEKRESSLFAQKRNLLLSFLHSKKKKDEIEYNLFCKETHIILKAIKEKFYNIDWLIEGKLCFIKTLPSAKHLPLLSVPRTVVGYEKEKNKYSLKAKKRKDIVSCLLHPKKAKEENFQREGDKKGFHGKHIPYVREHDAWDVKKRAFFLPLEEPYEQDKLLNLFMKEKISKLSGEKVDYNWQGNTLPPSETKHLAASSPVPTKVGTSLLCASHGQEKNSKKTDPFFAFFKEETKHSPPFGGAKLKRLDIFYNYIEKRIEPGQFTSLLRKMINKRYKNIFLSCLFQKKEAKEGSLYIKMKQSSSGVRSKAKAHMIGKDRNPSFAPEERQEISQIKIPLPPLGGKKSRVENKPSGENPSLDINYSSLKYRLIDIYLSIFDLFLFSLKKEYNSLTRYMSDMGRVLKEGKSKIGKKESKSKKKVEGSTYIKILQEQGFSLESDQASSQKSGASPALAGGHFRCENCFLTNKVSCKEEYKIRDLPSGVKSNPFLLFFNPREALSGESREEKGICIFNHFSTFYNIYIIYRQFFEVGKNKNFMISPILYKDFFKFFDLWKKSLKICPPAKAGEPHFSMQKQGGGRVKHLESKKVFSNLNILTPLYINTLPKEGKPLVFSPEGHQTSSQKSGASPALAGGHFRCENCFLTNKVSCKEEYKVEYNVRNNEKDYLVCNKLPPSEGTYGKEIVIRKKQNCSQIKNNFNPMIYQKTLPSCAKHGSDFIYFPINSNIKVDIIYYRFGLDFLIGIYGNYKTSLNLYRQIEDFLTENYYLSLEKHNLYNPSLRASSPKEGRQTIFRNYQISFLEWKQYYRKIQSLTLYMGKNVKGNSSFLTRFSSLREEEKGYSKFKYKIFLNLPILDIIRSLHKEGFCDGKGFPTSKKNWTILSDSRILKYFKNFLYSLRKYYSIIDYPKNWKKIEYILQHSCTMTIAHKHKTSLRKVLTFYGKKMRLNTDHK